MNDETRKLFSELGSRNVRDLAFRDSWVFVGAKGVHKKSPFEQVEWGAGPSTPDPRSSLCIHPQGPKISSKTILPNLLLTTRVVL